MVRAGGVGLTAGGSEKASLRINATRSVIQGKRSLILKKGNERVKRNIKQQRRVERRKKIYEEISSTGKLFNAMKDYRPVVKKK